ncbi:MAG: adenine phosphoribosyltransferase [Geodermatophilaceae bacterium]|nr:adenine phosphoribosyltransferase [Geodermatophilaceae bacterium]
MGPAATRRTLDEWLHAHVRVMDDFPKPGVVFQDLSPVYLQPKLVRGLAESMISVFRGRFDHVVAIDARGFVLGAVVAHLAQRPLVLLRKPGKLPGPVFSEHYELEYGAAKLEIQRDALPDGAKAVVVDDVLATGGTLAAAAALVEASNALVTGLAVVLEIPELGGRARLHPHPVFAAGRVGETTARTG